MAVAGLVATQPAQAAVCIGNCGSNAGVVDGSITAAPGNDGKYDWVSTRNGVQGAGQIAGIGGTDGSELISAAFFATAGQTISFNFNYVTSDGSGFADYGFAQLRNVNTGEIISLFTARTQPSGTIAPGFGLPGVAATLTPGSVPITAGAPSWSPLGSDSGRCFAAGCGYTGWIKSDYQVTANSTYELRFGVTNWSDTAYDSGLAFSGLVLDGSTIGDGSSPTNPLLPGEIDPDTGAFEFTFTVNSPTQTVWIDPLVATGYDYQVLTGPNILSASFIDLGDLDGYQIFDNAMNLLGTVPGTGGTFTFASGGVSGFKLRGIDTALMLDPANTTAFVTGLTFNVSGTTTITMTQTPVTTFVNGAVPEPGTWAMMIAGFGLAGAAMRRRTKRVTATLA